ncbi:acyloxyacyl hydrolase [Albidovulum sediminis]|uniref:Acyloxyacyl hydrolase n=1 Tax=Albidovulum sediminis TaxID=3066345 RepID=A0ABT2NHR9_9RHOB|nr:acyloxyacyl hydrolase [Defluviimonas sediminis]MCT8328465.1 acyloxyacyl hydrolase [Defluviimonas sediminis]
MRPSVPLRPAGLLPALLRPALIALALAGPIPAAAADLVFGLGYSDFNEPAASNSAILELEVHSRPRWHFAGADWSIAAAIVAHSEGDLFIGGGPAALWPLRDRWFVEASVMPGYFRDSGDGNDLGSNFEIRSLVGIGRRLNDTTAISLALTHKSNAGTSERNPGVNAVSLRLRRSF